MIEGVEASKTENVWNVLLDGILIKKKFVNLFKIIAVNGTKMEYVLVVIWAIILKKTNVSLLKRENSQI